MKSYGTPNEDTAPLTALMDAVKGLEVEHILHFPRVPVDARPCQLPLSLVVKAVLQNKAVVTAFQPSPGKRVEISVT